MQKKKKGKAEVDAIPCRGQTSRPWKNIKGGIDPSIHRAFETAVPMYVTVSGQAINPVARSRRGKGSYVASDSSIRIRIARWTGNRGGRRRERRACRAMSIFPRIPPRGKKRKFVGIPNTLLYSLSSPLFLSVSPRFHTSTPLCTPSVRS